MAALFGDVRFTPESGHSCAFMIEAATNRSVPTITHFDHTLLPFWRDAQGWRRKLIYRLSTQPPDTGPYQPIPATVADLE